MSPFPDAHRGGYPDGRSPAPGGALVIRRLDGDLRQPPVEDLRQLPGALPEQREDGAPQRQIIAETIQEGIKRGQIRPDLDIERALDLLLGAFFAAVFASGRPGPEWPAAIVDALWPALAADRP